MPESSRSRSGVSEADGPSSSPSAPVREDGRKTRNMRDESLVEQVRRMVLDDIIRGRLEPGSVVRLPAIAERCKVSRTPVREALSLLAREGVVSSIPYKGYLVREISPGDVNDVFFMRRIIEPAAADLAARLIEPSEIARLREDIASHNPSSAAMTLEDDEHAHDFHRTIIAATRSPRLLTTFEAVYNDVRRLQSITMGKPRPDLVDHEHLGILDALSDGDGNAARLLMEQHVDAMRKRAFEAWVGFDLTAQR